MVNTKHRPALSVLDQLAPLVRPDQSIEMLQALHIVTRDGKINQDSRRKLKQIYHLYQFIETELNRLDVEDKPIVLADLGAGKSYLGFLVYELFFSKRNMGEVIAIESRAELVSASMQLARTMRFDRMTFVANTVQLAMQLANITPHIDMVTALHACDTATDDAIQFGLKKHAKVLVLVPCCQAYGARLMNQNKAFHLSKTPLSELWRHPLHTRELGSQLTNVMRCLYLESRGYQVTVTELVGWEHSMKNELMIARFTGRRQEQSRERLGLLAKEFGLEAMVDQYFHD